MRKSEPNSRRYAWFVTMAGGPPRTGGRGGLLGSAAPREVTGLLLAWGEGNEDALQKLIPAVYQELRRLARYYLSRERAGHTLQATALVQIGAVGERIERAAVEPSCNHSNRFRRGGYLHWNRLDRLDCDRHMDPVAQLRAHGLGAIHGHTGLGLFRRSGFALRIVGSEQYACRNPLGRLHGGLYGGAGVFSQRLGQGRTRHRRRVQHTSTDHCGPVLRQIIHRRTR